MADGSWDTESEDVNMSWAAEAETTEAIREAERHETGAVVETLPEKATEDPAEKTEKRVRRPLTGAFMNFLPLEWKEDDVRKFLTTEVKIEDKKIVKVQAWKKFGKNQAIVTFDTEATLGLALKADKTKVGSGEIRIQREKKDKRPHNDGPNRYRQARNAPSRGSSAPSSNPFGKAKPNDKSMNKEREQILAEQQAAAAAAAAAPAEGEAKPEGAAAPAEGEAKPEAAAPAEGEAKTEAKPEAAAAAAEEKPKTEPRRDTRNHQRGNNRRGPSRKAESEKAAKAAALKQKQEEERQKALKKQQKEKMMKQKAEQEEKKKKEKTHNAYDALGESE